MKRVVKNLLIVLPAMAIMSCGQSSQENSSGIVKTGEENTKSEATTSDIDAPSDIGIGPIKAITIPDEVNAELAAQGQEVFNLKCTACHKPDVKHIGPALKDVDERRKPEWIMNMILNPTEMVAQDPVARELLMEYNGSPMANQNLTEDEARAVLEYFRSI